MQVTNGVNVCTSAYKLIHLHISISKILESRLQYIYIHMSIKTLIKEGNYIRDGTTRKTVHSASLVLEFEGKIIRQLQDG